MTRAWDGASNFAEVAVQEPEPTPQFYEIVEIPEQQGHRGGVLARHGMTGLGTGSAEIGAVGMCRRRRGLEVVTRLGRQEMRKLLGRCRRGVLVKTQCCTKGSRFVFELMDKAQELF